ncbi:PilZ domain-containing protein [Candidatus Omnitrophota bacterium]
MEERNGSTERRRFVRFNVQTGVTFQVQQKYQGQTPTENVSAITKNLSVEGVCFLTEKELKQGSMLRMEIAVPSYSEPLHLRGEVIWSIPLGAQGGKQVFETGVKLFTIKESDESRFIEYICNKAADDVT